MSMKRLSSSHFPFITFFFLYLPITAFSSAIGGAAPSKVLWQRTGNVLTVSGSGYRLSMDSKTGFPTKLQLKGKTAITFSGGGWWSLTFADKSILLASDCNTVISHVGDNLSVVYTSPKAQVNLLAHFERNRFDVSAKVHPVDDTVTRLAIPAEIIVSPDIVKKVDFPQELGIALKSDFFQPQSKDHPVSWIPVPLGPSGAAMAGISPTRMLDYNAPSEDVQVTSEGEKWLGGITSDMNNWKVRCPRPPDALPAITLLSTANGPLLSLDHVDGGWGWFVRWGGVFGNSDISRVISASVSALNELWNRPIESREKIPAPSEWTGKTRKQMMPAAIGIIDLDNSESVKKWWDGLGMLNCQLRYIHTPDELMQSLKAQDCWLIVNPYPEYLPADQADASQMAAAIRAYVAHGGVWLHTGSAPFWYALEPQRYLSISSDYPPAFSDFIHFSLTGGDISVYGVRKSSEIFVPAWLSAEGSSEGAKISREWITWVKPGDSWTSPITRFRTGNPMPESISEYAAENGYNKSLKSKLSAALLNKLKQSILLKYSGSSFQDEEDGLHLLPSPILIHESDYLHGGFDKQYPDHLPPNPAMGTPDDFASLISAVHKAGDIFMPYTNPTWWCDHPRGPTFLQNGEAPLLKDQQGAPVREIYGANDGWSLCAFHPAALKAEKRILDQFTQQYPADILFQDQVGARGPMYDFNSASPTPYAYTQGMMNIARRDSAVIPLGTENGFDAVMNSETLFCGDVWNIIPTQYSPSWAQLWKQKYPAGTWQLAPMALWMGHDRVIFTMHDLGQFVTNREVLVWVLAMGYHLSAVTNVAALQNPTNKRWIDWLASLQQAIGPYLDGAKLEDWKESTPGVYASKWGDLRIIANTTVMPIPFSQGIVLSPFGFYISGKGIEAGWLDEYKGKSYPNGLAFVRHDGKSTIYNKGK
jgi:hypothetical protein